MSRGCGLSWAGFGWRLRHLWRRGSEAAARRLLVLMIRARWLRPLLRHLPRRPVAALERALIAAADTALFDAELYLERNPDVRAAGIAPLAHYLRHGWAEGRDPNAWLDEVSYRRQAGLEPADRVSALAHYLAVGRNGGRNGGRSAGRGLEPGTASGPGVVAGTPNAPRAATESEDSRIAGTLARLAALTPRGENAVAEVDVIVPIYRGRAETLRCLASVLEAANRTRFRLVAIDDRGPDPALRADLARLARRGLIELVVQPRNLGFVAAVNAGMGLRPQRDVIWLNADTEVWGDWIDRLRNAASAAPDIATVTPLTNNGTICGYPRFCVDNFDAPETGWAGIDRIAAAANPGQVVEAPTCVGFCTYVKRAALDDLGVLDEAAFGRGYGEENDFSQRAVRAGWRNLIAGDVFVYHAGQTSFGDARAKRVEAALRVVERRYPGYRRAVRRFIERDPVAPLRRAIDVERLRQAGWPARVGAGRQRGRQRGRRRNVLIVSHSLGGGTGQHVGEEVARLRAEGAGVVLMSGGEAGPDSVRLGHPDIGALPSLAALTLGGRGFTELLRGLGITEVHLHHLADFGRGAAARFAWLMEGLDLPFEFIVHDYLAICPRINLADSAGMYCGEPDAAGCRRCLMRRRSRFGAPEITRWRRDYGTLLGMARQVRVPDRDVAERLRRRFPRLANIVVRPHDGGAERVVPRVAGAAVLTAARRRALLSRPMRIATIGAIGPIKGFDVLLDLAGEIRARGAPIELSVIGYTRNDPAARAAGITVTGPYRDAEAAAVIAAVDPDLMLIPSTWPETYCYTLSHALASGRPVAGFDIGAVGTRIRDGGWGRALPLALARDPAALLDRLLDLARYGGAAATPGMGLAAGGTRSPAG